MKLDSNFVEIIVISMDLLHTIFLEQVSVRYGTPRCLEISSIFSSPADVHGIHDGSCARTESFELRIFDRP